MPAFLTCHTVARQSTLHLASRVQSTMTTDAARRRIQAIHGHIAEGGQRTSPVLLPQDCAASSALRYARACAFQDVSYARVGTPQAHEVHREKTALEFAEHTLWALEKGSDRFKGIPDPPAYARPALDDAPVEARPPQRQERAPAAAKPPVTPLKPEVRRALTRVARLRSARALAPRVTSGWTPKVDAMETSNFYQLEVALPGVRKEDLRVELWGPFMTVSGTRAAGHQHGGRGVVLRRELESGGFSATWKLPANGRLDSLYAESIDGMLRIYLRKRKTVEDVTSP